ncbi:hypothetical protein DFH06DRAFT_1153736 [Mycena polygramma]|nr:hypothetical protein DFH06DRAFT_1153736 [Mycena polygramma]
MKFSLILAALAAPLLTAATDAAVTQRAPLGLNPTNITLHPIVDDGIPPPTNAERLRRGLPLKAPRLPTRVGGARRADASPITYSGKIRVTTDSGTILGFIAGKLDQYGSTDMPAAGGPQDVSTGSTGPSKSLQYFAGVEGYFSLSDDLATNSPNYLVLAASTHTPAGSSVRYIPNSSAIATGQSQSPGESVVWSYNPATGALTPQWINTDGSSPTTNNGVFSFTGSPDVFRANYGPADLVTFTLVV